jgi:hypothetical protein
VHGEGGKKERKKKAREGKNETMEISLSHPLSNFTQKNSNFVKGKVIPVQAV